MLFDRFFCLLKKIMVMIGFIKAKVGFGLCLCLCYFSESPPSRDPKLEKVPITSQEAELAYLNLHGTNLGFA